MKALFSFIILTLSLLASATTYYIDPAGSNTNDGSAAHPWLTLSYACTKAVKPGDIIYVNPGDYTEPNRCNLTVEISITGAGETSHIISTYSPSPNSTDGSIFLYSYSEGTNGDQSISNIKLDGSNLAGRYGIAIHNRSNVKIHHCTIVNFEYTGIYIGQGTSFGKEPSVYSTGNEIYNCTIRNCSTRTLSGNGLIRFSGQDGLLIHDNILDQTTRSPEDGGNGNIIDAVEGFNKAFKYYNNKSYKLPGDISWNFHIESWTTRGGCEISNNEFHGGGTAIDIAGVNNIKGDYDYSWWVHDNLIAMNSMISEAECGYHIPCAINFEATNEDAIVNDNHILNYPVGIVFDISQDNRHMNNIKVYNNIYENMGLLDYGFTFVNSLKMEEDADIINAKIENIYFYNNVINGHYRGAFRLAPINNTDIIRNIYIRNNIVEDSQQYGWLSFWYSTGTIENIYVQNNLLYNNVNSNAIFYSPGRTVKNVVKENNILNRAPLYISPSDFNLQKTSPAVDAGINVGLPYYGMAPDIGAFETPDGELHLNQLPVVSISSPTKGNSYKSPATVTIDIEAHDPDGTISKVELFNGTAKLGERTTAPYSFTLKDLPEGSYSLNAVAIDNLKSATTSSTLDLQVTSNNENREFFNLYPNPNNGRFSINFTTAIEADNFTVTVVNLIGRTVYREELSKEEDTRDFDLSHLNPGIYVLMITSNEILLTQKFIKG